MGKKDSSSKRKSSKRKSSKIVTSQKKKKSRSNRLKKARHAEHSVSSYSDDESKNLSSGSEFVYASSSEDDHKNRKGRSRARGEAKSRKKKGRRSSSPESNPKKRKRSKKDVKLKSRKKSRKGKGKRDLSLSSAGESQSCSSSSEEREPRKKRGRSRESRKHKRDRIKVKIKRRISSSKSPSCSYSRDSHHTNNMSHGEEEVTTEHVSRRLRSVITVVKREEEEDIAAKDPYEEEMLYDRFDYPSSRSNDSYDGLNKNESDIALDKTETEGNEKIEKEGYPEYGITDGATNAGDPAPFHSSQEPEIKHGDISSIVSEPTEDLELLLRQKALENLRKFIVEKQKKLKTKVPLEGQSETKVIQSSAAPTSNAYEEPVKLDSSIEQDPAAYMKNKNNCSTPTETNTGHSVRVESESPYEENRIGHPVPSLTNSSEISEKEKNNIAALGANVKLGSATPGSRQKVVLSNPVMKPRASSQAHPVSNSVASPARSPSLTSSFKNNETTRVVVGVSSSLDNELKVSELTPEEKIATEQQDLSKDGSQYEEKTMSVMRGGEMVQVSYKVYIPKKTPALHRRQLRR